MISEGRIGFAIYLLFKLFQTPFGIVFTHHYFHEYWQSPKKNHYLSSFANSPFFIVAGIQDQN